MHYKITHSTIFAYSDPVSICQNQVMLTPRNTPWTRFRNFNLRITPTPAISGRRNDYYGNQVHEFSIDESHRRLSIVASSFVDVTSRPDPLTAPSPPWEAIAVDVQQRTDPHWFHAAEFLFDSPRIRRRTEFADYARESFQPGRPVVDAAFDLTQRVHRDIQYARNETDVGTTPEEVFRTRKGVCQDLAQLEIACLRSIGLPARYVSGYLRTIPPEGQPRRIGADESHAWISVYGASAGWVDIDPTNRAFCIDDHVPVAWGRDYSDVTPIRGVYIGGGTSRLEVKVDVCPEGSA